MSVINTNVSSLIAQNALAKNQAAENTSLERLSTGLKINSGADDPSGLIASEGLQSEQAGITQAISNAGQASNVVATAEGGLSEVSSLLTQVQSLVSQSANSGAQSSDEIAANQLQVDSILDTINKTSNSTSFDGKQLLNGNLGYSTSGAATSAFSTIQINSASLADNSTLRVKVNVTNSATTGQLTFGAANTLGGAGYLSGTATTLTVAGANGTQQLSFAASASLSSVANAVNQYSANTGVSATVSGTSLKLDSNAYGSANFVSVTASNSDFATKNAAGTTATKSDGTDAKVTVNGVSASVNGTDVSYHSGNLDVDLTLSSALNKGQSKSFTITGGGATFQVGSSVTENGKVSIGIGSVSTSSLGNATVGYLESLGTGGANSLSSGNFDKAQKILTAAVSQVSDLRGRIGAFQTYTLGSTTSNLQVASENAASAESAITDTNFASETANLTKEQILSSAAQTVLSTANSRPQSVLSLLQSA